MFSVGFMSLLHIVLNKVIDFPSWEGALISIPRIKNICDPGTYYSNFTTTAYCQDSDGNIQKSIQCIQCPENMYTDLPDQYQCKMCAVGFFSLPGSSSCTSCYDRPDNITSNAIKTTCTAFINDQAAQKRQLYMSIFIPIGIILCLIALAFLCRYLRRRWLSQRTLGSDEDWLLSFNELVKPPIHQLESNDNKKITAQKPLLSKPERSGSRSSSSIGIGGSVMAVNDLNPCIIDNESTTATGEEGGGIIIRKQKPASTKDTPPYHDSRFDPDLQHVNHIHHQQEKGEIQGVVKNKVYGSPTSITTVSTSSSSATAAAAHTAGGSLFTHKGNHTRSAAVVALTLNHHKTDSRSIVGKPEFIHALGSQ